MKFKFNADEILTKNGQSFLVPFILITCCFAMWGFSNDMTGPLVKAFSKIFRMGVTEGSFVQVAYYLGYFAMAFPAALFIQRKSYKAGVMLGLSLFYMCLTDNPARAFTQQWLMLLLFGYSTVQILFRPDPWKQLHSMATEEAEEPNHSNAVYRATLEAWLEQEKPYLNPDFQLTDLRQVLPLNRTYLSQLINTEYGCSFYHWVNGLRIAEAKRLLTENPEMKLKDIAQQSGFSSPTVFSRVFIRETGISPREWK